MKQIPLKLGTRGSKLALWQANWVKDRLENQNPGLGIEIVIISTHGDRDQSQPLEQMGQTGIFVKEIERALQEELIDFAVHSAKDLPSRLLPEFEMMAFTKREDPRDVLLAKNGRTVGDLPAGARLATG
ncbi:MAG: hydroxymethylbilane synthase, partial [Calditrichaeota bacterium]|nr:hydroxymethylbilane synthase [Calditrichota bacterium]